jgi:uncharacterized protein YbjT (DUF2867 family)
MILVTGAGGKTGRTIIRALAKRGAAVRALTRSADTDLGASETIIGDMQSPDIWPRAVSGVSAVYHICPNMNPHELSIGRAVIAAAQAAGVNHFVYHSVLHPHIEAMPHHWLKLRVEELLFESGLNYTILQPAAYMQNILAHWPQIVSQGNFPAPYAAEARLSLVHVDDLAQAAAEVLTNPAVHAGATYEIVGTAPLSQIEVANILGRALGRLVQVDVIPLEVWRQQAQQAGLGVYQINTLVKMFEYYQRFGFAGNPAVLTWLLGCAPVSFTEFVEQIVQLR